MQCNPASLISFVRFVFGKALCAIPSALYTVVRFNCDWIEWIAFGTWQLLCFGSFVCVFSFAFLACWIFTCVRNHVCVCRCGVCSGSWERSKPTNLDDIFVEIKSKIGWNQSMHHSFRWNSKWVCALHLWDNCSLGPAIWQQLFTCTWAFSSFNCMRWVSAPIRYGNGFWRRTNARQSGDGWNRSFYRFTDHRMRWGVKIDFREGEIAHGRREIACLGENTKWPQWSLLQVPRNRW